MRIKTTKQHREWWKNRKIDWKQAYLSTWNHPHRDLFVQVLRSFNWFSLWEIGCGPGANLAKITKEIPGKQLGGSDINPDAIELARQTFNGGKFHVESMEDMLLSDNSVDVILSDASLIYIGPSKIDQAMEEIRRIVRHKVILCEFHSDNWWKKLVFRFKTGYNAYDYRKLLENNGFYDIQVIKLPDYWKGDPWKTWGHIIIATKAK